MDNRFLTAIALILALTAPASAQDLTLESHAVDILPENTRAQRYSNVARVSLMVRNNTDQTVKAWRVQASFSDPFGDEMFSIQLTSGTASISPGATEMSIFEFEDNQFIDGQPYDMLASYSSDNISVTFSDVRVVH